MLVYVEWKAEYLYDTVGIVFNLVFGLHERWHNACSCTNRIEWFRCTSWYFGKSL